VLSIYYLFESFLMLLFVLYYMFVIVNEVLKIYSVRNQSIILINKKKNKSNQTTRQEDLRSRQVEAEERKEN
jgi:hypothetical protein